MLSFKDLFLYVSCVYGCQEKECALEIVNKLQESVLSYPVDPGGGTQLADLAVPSPSVPSC